jgi:Domain of unknown function (DUF4266)
MNRLISQFPNRLSAAARLAMGAVIATGIAGLFASLGGCAFVPQKDREFLSDPIMQRHDDVLESGLESHDMPRREGAVGGSSGSGGGCGC